MTPKLEAIYRAELAKIEAMAAEPRPALYLVPVALDLRKPVEAYRRVLPKATMDDNGEWITEPFTLTRTERGLSDRRVGDETP